MAFKLSNGLVTVSDLARERGLLAALLEWFNFPEWLLEAEVLGLLLRLAEVPVYTTGTCIHVCACMYVGRGTRVHYMCVHVCFGRYTRVLCVHVCVMRISMFLTIEISLQACTCTFLTSF